MKIFVIDSGTTSSRVRLYDGERIVGSASRQAGAKDIAISGDKSVVAPLVRERYPGLEVAVVPEEDSDRLSAIGAMRIFERYQVQ